MALIAGMVLATVGFFSLNKEKKTILKARIEPRSFGS